MREIKFRGKRIDNNEWVYGNLLIDYFSNKYFIHFFEPILGNYTFEVMPNTVGQYTGLKDKNGKEIYEGDVVKWGTGNWVIQYGIKSDTSSAGYYAICIESRETFYCFSKTMSCLEIIGNLYDNPELFK